MSNDSLRYEVKSLHMGQLVEAAGIEPAQDSPRWQAWAGGLFEGEGSIFLDRSRFNKGNGRLRLVLSLSSTDLDVLNRFCEVVSVGKVPGPYERPRSTKPYWIWQVRREGLAEQAADLLLPYLGERRRQQLSDVLAEKAKVDRTHIPRQRSYHRRAGQLELS